MTKALSRPSTPMFMPMPMLFATSDRWPMLHTVCAALRSGPMAWLVALLLAGAWMAAPAHAQRVALVVGNAAYADKPLRNPVNDAELMQRTLQGLGFEVSLVRNADRRGLLAGLRDFEAKARNADVALFYFAGHGTQVGGNNYLLPLQAQIRSESDVPDEAVDASSVLRRIEDAKARIGLVILDACRDSPYASATRSGSRGLGRMSVPTGSIVAYATAPGSTAEDGSGRNGVYTQELARQLATPGLDLRDVFDRTAMEVERITGGKQKPREDVGLRGRFVLNAHGTPASPLPSPPAVPVLAPVTATTATVPAAPVSPVVSAATVALADAGFPGGRPLTLVVPFAAGGSTDISARLLATELSATLGSAVVVENRPGAGGTIGMAQVGGAAPDGLTLLVHHLGMATAEAMYRNLPTAARQSAFEPIGLFLEFPMILAARPNLSAGTGADAAAWLRTHSGRLNMATAGLGSASHLCALVLESALAMRLNTIPYRGSGPALSDLMAGQTDVMCDAGTSLTPQLEAGKLLGLGVVSAMAPPTGTAARSLPRMPLPAAGQLTVWHGLYAPNGTPAAVVARLGQALQAATRSARFKAGNEALGAVVVTDSRSTPTGLGQWVAAESVRLGALIRGAGAFAD